MKSFEHYSKTFFEATERGLANYRSGDEKLFSLISKSVSPNTGNAERIATVFKIIKEFLPKGDKFNKSLEMFFANPGKLPFDEKQFSFEGKIGKGGQCDVFLLKSKDPKVPSYVMKIQRKYNLDSIDDKVRGLNEEKKDYEKVRDIYKDVPGLIPAEFSLIAENHSKFVKESRVALIQQFQGTDIRDFFNEVSERDIFEICKRDEAFLAKLRKFLDITLKTLDEEGMVIDLFGVRNLVVTKNEDKFDLVFLDPHLFYSKDDKETWNNVEADSFVAYMRHLKRSLDSRFA